MMQKVLTGLSLTLLLFACASGGAGPAPEPAAVDTAGQARAIREMLTQSAALAVNRLGQPDGYAGDPRVRIPLPEELMRLDKTLRRLGLERYTEEFVDSLNRAAEQAVPAAKPILVEAVRKLTLADAVSIVRGDETAATRYFRAGTEKELFAQLKPLIAQATGQTGVTAAYKRMLRKATLLDKRAEPGRLDLDNYVTQGALDGLFVMLADEERRIRRDPRARTTDLLKKVFR